MEISLLKDTSIKIKSKTCAVIVDPVSKTDGDVVILTNPADSLIDAEKVESSKITIDGAGEYEIGGMSITIIDKGELLYSFYADSMKVLLLSESMLSKLKEEDEYNAIIVKVNEEVKDTVFSNLPSDLFIFYGDLEKVQLKEENIKKVSKVNLKKKEEYEGSIILLS